MRRKLIAPSVLSADFVCLRSQVEEVAKAGADLLHIDVMDGVFVPNLTMGPAVVAALARISSLPLDVHLMISDPDRYLAAFAEAGAAYLTVHAEATPHLYRTLETIHKLGVKAGVALNPASGLHMLEWVWDRLDLVLIMTVEPGFGGQEFIEAMLPKIRDARAHLDRVASPALLAVDGGINARTAVLASEAGAEVLVAGSAIFGTGDAAAAVRAMRAALTGTTTAGC